MILQADIPFMGNAFLETLEIFEFAVGNHIIPLFAPQSILNDLFTILGMRHFAILHFDHDRVPFAGRFYRFRIGREHIIQRTGKVVCQLVVGSIHIIQHLHFGSCI